MDMIPLQATLRDLKQSLSDIRKARQVPCVVYGNETKNTPLTCGENDVIKTYQKAGESTLVELAIDGKKVPVLIHAVQFEPVSGRFAHIDFYAVDMKKEIEAPVTVRFTGESLAVKDLAAVFVSVQNHVTVRALPADLPRDLEVSMAKLAAIHDVLTVADLVLPKGVKVKDAPTTVLATVQEQRKEEEVLPAAGTEAVPVDGAAPAPGAEGVEGAAPAAAAAPDAKAADKGGDKKKAK